jgi:hypothetical protein
MSLPMTLTLVAVAALLVVVLVLAALARRDPATGLRRIEALFRRPPKPPKPPGPDHYYRPYWS